MNTKSFVLNNTIQMIDINEDYQSFYTVYNITCDNLQDEFEYATVSQKNLDENQFHFKKATGYIEDAITKNNSEYQDWYLVLRSNKDTPCTILLNITSLDSPKSNLDDLEPEEQEQPISRKQFNRPQQPQRRQSKRKERVYVSDSESENDEPPKNTYNWSKYIFIIVFILLLLILGLWWTGYIYKLPYINKLIAIPPPSLPPPSQQPLPQQPQINIQPLSIPTPITNTSNDLLQQQPYVPDTNFINEMRELKID